MGMSRGVWRPKRGLHGRGRQEFRQRVRSTTPLACGAFEEKRPIVGMNLNHEWTPIDGMTRRAFRRIRSGAVILPANVTFCSFCAFCGRSRQRSRCRILRTPQIMNRPMGVHWCPFVVRRSPSCLPSWPFVVLRAPFWTTRFPSVLLVLQCPGASTPEYLIPVRPWPISLFG